MPIKKLLCLLMSLSFACYASASDIADAAKRGDTDLVRSLIAQKVDVNEPQVDGSTALLWMARHDEVETAQLLIEAGANPSTGNRTEAYPLEQAAINGSAAMLDLLIKAGVDPNVPVTHSHDTALMLAARTGISPAVKVLLDNGADVNAEEPWGHTTALMWAVAENNAEVVSMLIKAGANINARTVFVPPDTGRGFEGSSPRERRPEETGPVQFASGELTPLMFAAREGHVASGKLLIEAKADVNAIASDGKDALSLAIFNGNFEFANLMIDSGAALNQADANGFTPLFWAVDRRNMETAPNFPWTVMEDPLPLVKKLLDAGADPNKLINNTPRGRMRGGAPRIVFATPIMRAAFSADLELVKLLYDYGADVKIKSSDNETTLSAAAGIGFITGFHKERPLAERLEVIKFLVDRGLDVNWHDDYGITALMAAANLGDVPIIQYLIDQGAELNTYDLGKKNDGAFGASIEPLMPIDYAIGVGTFRPNNAIVFNEAAVNLMTRIMQERGIVHTTSECTLRGFTCSAVNMDPRSATPAIIATARKLQTGHQVEGIKGSGLEVEDDCLDVTLPFGEVAKPDDKCVDKDAD